MKFADNGDPRSLASRMRLRRNEHFRTLVERLPRPLSILDVGGTASVWERIGFAGNPDISITLLNLEAPPTGWDNISAVTGDACDMRQFADAQFDVVYSNSVIEHVGDDGSMRRMAGEIRRIGKRYFLQTPNRYFPVEPHFVFPLFQFLPHSLRIALVRRFALGWMERQPARDAAARDVGSIRLLSRRDVRTLLPDATLEIERLLGLAKSIIAHDLQPSPDLRTL